MLVLDLVVIICVVAIMIFLTQVVAEKWQSTNLYVVHFLLIHMFITNRGVV
ncbi:hypothetical protein RchiOBHm_Chr3g0492411 [Rosa chinensis]|uniref:Uncharacterized protein n=1 Tax=Rosa chinensis TaxID=74649 RepID=A0A2P6RGG8_ROSCH|nr:hypothetical protein RchiOBHm_Chr3g0492411 [Rosa chinensis]